MARDLEDITTSITSTDSAHSSSDNAARQSPSPHGGHMTRRNIDAGGDRTPIIDGENAISGGRGIRKQRHRSTGGIRDNSSAATDRIRSLSPTIPNVNIISASGTESTTPKGDTVIHAGRQLPPVPPPMIPTSQTGTFRTPEQQQESFRKNANRGERPSSFIKAMEGSGSNGSDSATDRSLNRSIPYYEVPSTNLPYNPGRNAASPRTTQFQSPPPTEYSNLDETAGSTVTHITFRSPSHSSVAHISPPPVPSTINVPVSSPEGRAYSLIDRSGHHHSQLI